MARIPESPPWQSYEGQFLIAMPSLRDGPFARSVVYMCAHREDGAMGIVINQRAEEIEFSRLLVQLDVVGEAEAIRLPASAEHMRVLRGGPVDTGRGFVLHSGDYRAAESTVPIGGGVCLTATLDILKAIARGDGPASAILALGYAGWAPGQLESEIQGNGWLHCAPDSDLIFGTDIGGKYGKALKKLGVDVGMLSSEAGHA
jgi:putative transcriptional regulator